VKVAIISILDEAGLSSAQVREVQRRFEKHLRGPVEAIYFDIAGGGGDEQYFELAEMVYQARKRKRIVSNINAHAASGAYLLAASAGEVTIVPEGLCGGLGAVVMIPGALASFGILACAPEGKGHWWPRLPVDEVARADVKFVKVVAALARYRGVSESHVRERFGAGGYLNAFAAWEAGMVDRVQVFNFLQQRATPDLSPEGQLEACRILADCDPRYEQAARRGRALLGLDGEAARLAALREIGREDVADELQREAAQRRRA
jgi:hypothetical protein